MNAIKKYLKADGILNFVVMGFTLLASLYVLLIEHRLISQYIQNLPEGGNKVGAGIGLGFLLVLLIIAAVIMLAFALGELIVGLMLLTDSKRDEFRRTPLRAVLAGVGAKLLSGAGFAFLCIFSFDTAGFSLFSRGLYALGLLVSVGCAIASIVFAVLIRNEENAVREGKKEEFFY